MTLLTVPWPLPKASVEYTWVHLHKLLLSALKSVGSPTQQMGGGGRSERKLTEWEREKKRELVWLILNGGRQTTFPLRVSHAERATGGASMLGSHTQMFACVDFVFVLIVHMHAAVCVLAYGSAGMSVYACAFVSVCPYYFAWSSGQLPGNCGRQLSTRPGRPRSRRFNLSVVLISATGQHWYITGQSHVDPVNCWDDLRIMHSNMQTVSWLPGVIL